MHCVKLIKAGSIRNYFILCNILFYYFEGKPALRDITEYGGNNADNGIPDRLGHPWQADGKYFDQHIGK